jgi:hypothetical protein
VAVATRWEARPLLMVGYHQAMTQVGLAITFLTTTILVIGFFRHRQRRLALGRFPAILAVTHPDFSAAQTVWRRERDSNLCLAKISYTRKMSDLAKS